MASVSLPLSLVVSFLLSWPLWSRAGRWRGRRRRRRRRRRLGRVPCEVAERVRIVHGVADRHAGVFRGLPLVGVIVGADDVVRDLVDHRRRLEVGSGVEPIRTEVEVGPDRVDVCEDVRVAAPSRIRS